MGQRQIDHVAIIAAEEIDVLPGGPDMQIGTEHALRGTSRARRVEDHLQVIGLDRALKRRRLVACFVQSLFADNPEPGTCRRLPDRHDIGQRPTIDISETPDEIGLRHHQPCIGIVDDALQQAALVGKVDRHRDGAEIVDRKPDPQRHRPMRQPDQHLVVLPDAKRGKARRRPPDLSECIGIGPAETAIEDRIDAISQRLRPRLQKGAQDAGLGRRYPRIGVGARHSVGRHHIR